MTFFALIVRLENDNRVKILESKNIKKIRKELICVRKFLGLQDTELAIYDETRKTDGSKKDNRYFGKPQPQQLINSKGESLVEEEDELEIVAPADQSSDGESDDDRNNRKED